MTVARAALRDEIAVVLEHVQMVFAHQALGLGRGPLVRGGHAQVDRDALERLRPAANPAADRR